MAMPNIAAITPPATNPANREKKLRGWTNQESLPGEAQNMLQKNPAQKEKWKPAHLNCL
jgi:hypothetical protein